MPCPERGGTNGQFRMVPALEKKPMSRNAKTFVLAVAGLSPSLPASAADCNQNGTLDVCDISCAASGCASVVGCGRSNDCNANGVPDECDTFAATSVRSVRVASASEAVFMTAPPGDSRLWIVEKAGRIIAAFEEAETDGRGVVTVDGRMIENLHVEEARRVLAITAAIAAFAEG